MNSPTSAEQLPGLGKLIQSGASTPESLQRNANINGSRTWGLPSRTGQGRAPILITDGQESATCWTHCNWNVGSVPRWRHDVNPRTNKEVVSGFGTKLERVRLSKKCFMDAFTAVGDLAWFLEIPRGLCTQNSRILSVLLRVMEMFELIGWFCPSLSDALLPVYLNFSLSIFPTCLRHWIVSYRAQFSR